MGLKSNNIHLLPKIKLLEIKNKRLENKVRSLEEKLLREKKQSYEIKRRSEKKSIESYTGYFRYKYNTLKSTDVWTATERIFTYSRRSLFAARLLRYTALAVALIETSAVFLIFTSALAIILPVTLMCAALVFLCVMLIGNKQSRMLIPMIGKKKIVFIFTSESYFSRKNGYFGRTVSEFANDGRYFVFIVSSSLKDGFFLTSRAVFENAHILREAYYFKLMRAIRKCGINQNQIITVH